METIHRGYEFSVEVSIESTDEYSIDSIQVLLFAPATGYTITPDNKEKSLINPIISFSFSADTTKDMPVGNYCLQVYDSVDGSQHGEMIAFYENFARCIQAAPTDSTNIQTAEE